ncbi:hypothetical protein G4H71_19720 [Rhodococcus triatomae]|nr:hypothetical protein G4H72_10660 [Rhodococcus triatomae]QNG25896.1 hypothetical protein G4H71_19720 [Rhodococcus triatomae]
MFTAAAFVPSPPLLVPELSGRTDDEFAPVRAAVLDTGRALAERARRWVVVGVADGGSRPPAPESVGSFLGYGADVRVRLSPVPSADPPDVEVDAEWPLAALVAGWIRGRVGPDVTASVVLLDEECTPEAAAAAGAAVRRELDAVTEPVALLVVADGAITLTERAPGALDLRAPEVQAELDEALRSGRRDLLAALDPSLCRELGIGGRAPWQAMAGAFMDDPTQTTSDYCGAPYGVGYHVGTWLP